METVTIQKYRIMPIPMIGIGWVAVQQWNHIRGEYKHLSAFRSEDQATQFISALSKRVSQ